MVILMNHAPPAEGVHHTEHDVVAYYKRKSLGKGTLYIAESVLSWVTDAGEGFSLEYPSIFIHAISRDRSNFPEECLYLMVDGEITIGEEEPNEISNALNNLSVEENEDNDSEDQPVEMRFVPDNKNMLDVMFRALSDCQALNPDPADMSDGDDGLVYSENGFPVTAASFLIQEGKVDMVGDGDDDLYGEVNGIDEEEGMNEEQFEDAEQ